MTFQAGAPNPPSKSGPLVMQAALPFERLADDLFQIVVFGRPAENRFISTASAATIAAGSPAGSEIFTGKSTPETFSPSRSLPAPNSRACSRNWRSGAGAAGA